MKKTLTRRKFLIAALSAGAAGIAWLQSGRLSGVQGADDYPEKVYLPHIANIVPTPTPVPTVAPTTTPVPPTGKPRVVRVHHASVTTWNRSGSYWDAAYLSQAKTTQMVENGIKMLTSKSTLAQAWGALLPNYQSGQRIAIKVNFNNTMAPYDCGTNPPEINALPQVVMPLIAGLKSIGVAEQNIGIYDGVNRRIPPYFYNPIHAAYPGVVFYDLCHTAVGLSSQSITFSPPGGTFTQKIAKPAEDATYLINVPIMKNHSGAGVTLGFKNHFGTVEDPGNLHIRTFVTDQGTQYSLTYNPLVDIYKSPLIGPKTILTVGDGIYGALGAQDVIPNIWPNTFEDYPKSLFFAKDPVAIDCVMADFLDAEYGNWENSSNYLLLAQSAGLGVFDHVSDPLSNPSYTKLDYQLINLI